MVVHAIASVGYYIGGDVARSIFHLVLVNTAYLIILAGKKND